MGGSAIRAHRHWLGMSQEKYAKQLGFTKVHICKVETGVTSPTGTLKRAMETFKEN